MKSKMPKISIIIRTKNEEQWIAHCLKMVYSQTITDIEVIIVDNMSTDNTMLIAQEFPVKTIQIEKYLPGELINSGIRVSTGEYIVCLSDHCIPKHERWLEKLLQNFDKNDPWIAGVYGRQIPFKYSSAVDKRDLLITFGLDKRIQKKDAFFHNANSMIPRYVWDQIPFDENVTNIEDRVWGQEVIKNGYKLIYEPEAEVFHCHGIHHNNLPDRCYQTVKIMEQMHMEFTNDIPVSVKPGNARIIAVVPLIGDIKVVGGVNLLQRSIRQIKDCSYIKDIVVVSDKDSILNFVTTFNVKTVKRGPDHIGEGKSIENSMAFALHEYEQKYGITDSVLFVNYLFPFRPENFFSDLIENYAYSGSDSSIAALKDYNIFWVNEGDGYRPVGKSFKPRSEKNPMYQGLIGLGCITTSRFIRKKMLLGDNIELLDVQDAKYSLKVSDEYSETIAGYLLGEKEQK